MTRLAVSRTRRFSSTADNLHRSTITEKRISSPPNFRLCPKGTTDHSQFLFSERKVLLQFHFPGLGSINPFLKDVFPVYQLLTIFARHIWSNFSAVPGSPISDYQQKHLYTDGGLTHLHAHFPTGPSFAGLHPSNAPEHDRPIILIVRWRRLRPSIVPRLISRPRSFSCWTAQLNRSDRRLQMRLTSCR